MIISIVVMIIIIIIISQDLETSAFSPEAGSQSASGSTRLICSRDDFTLLWCCSSMRRSICRSFGSRRNTQSEERGARVARGLVRPGR